MLPTKIIYKKLYILILILIENRCLAGLFKLKENSFEPLTKL